MLFSRRFALRPRAVLKRRAMFGAALAALAWPSAAHGQTKAATKHAAAPSGPSTLSGIYTKEQAGRGKDVYAGSCRSCHTPSSHTGATFAKWWKGKQVSDLFGFISTNMPKNNPGTLDPGDVADLVAYLLQMNAMPVGSAELPPDVDSLKKFRIETKPAARASSTRRSKS